jgi:uncharacterized protein (TIGR02268 family)
MRMPPRFYRAAVTALLACATLARAQQSPMVRVRREQQLVLARMPAGSELELRVAPDIITVMRFDAQVEHVEVKRAGFEHLVWWDVAGQSLLIEPRQDLASVGPLPLEVVLVQGAIRTRLTFQLVSHPGEVDMRVDVELRPRSARSEQEPVVAFPMSEGGPFSRLVFSGVMGKPGVTGGMFRGRIAGSGVIAERPWDYRAERGRAITFLVNNPVEGRPWVASEVVRLSRAGEVRKGGGQWTVSMEAPIAPGFSGRVVVESAEDGTGAPVLLEVREAGGSRSVRVEEAR